MAGVKKQPSLETSLVRQVCEDTLTGALAATCGLGVALVLVGSRAFDQPWQGGLLGLAWIASSLLGLLVFKHSYLMRVGWLLAVWILSAVICSVLLPRSRYPVVFLLAVPAMFAAWFAGRKVGVLTGLMVGAATFFLASLTPLSVEQITVAVIVIWSAVMFTALIRWSIESNLTPLYRAYDRAQQELGVAREYQGELNQAVKDLADANLHMARLNQMLDAARHRAEEAERVKAEFTANVSHELRTPLNIVIGFSEAMLDARNTYGVNLPPALKADLVALHRNSQHLSNLISDVLDISQLEAQRMSLNKEWASLAEIVDEAALAVRPMLAARGLHLEAHVPDELPPIYGDRTRIRQVLLNLLSNAGRFTDRGGITVDVAHDEHHLIVTVSDTGIGIAEEDLPRLMQPFHQLDASIRRKREGSGLGLNISRRFIELHDGQMGVRSKLGVGTSVWFSLPVKQHELKANHFGRWLAPDWQQRQRSRLTPEIKVIPRIIVLEPDSRLRDAAIRYLDDVEIESAESVREVETLLAHEPAQMVVVSGDTERQANDWVLEVSAANPNTPVIGCCLPTRALTEQFGIRSYLTKPITRDALLEAIGGLDALVRSILLVEDDPDALQLFTRLLSSKPHQYRVLQVGSGREALDLMRARRPDLVLLDITLPDMDGFAVLDEKNRDTAIQDIPVLVLSATDPSGQPVLVSRLLATRNGGISLPEFLRCALAVSRELDAKGAFKELSALSVAQVTGKPSDRAPATAPLASPV